MGTNYTQLHSVQDEENTMQPLAHTDTPNEPLFLQSAPHLSTISTRLDSPGIHTIANSLRAMRTQRSQHGTVKTWRVLRDRMSLEFPPVIFVHVKVRCHNDAVGKLAAGESLLRLLRVVNRCKLHKDLHVQSRQTPDNHHHTPQPFLLPFFGTTRVSRRQMRTSGLYGARED